MSHHLTEAKADVNFLRGEPDYGVRAANALPEPRDLLVEILDNIRVEVLKAIHKHAPMNGPHEAFAVLKEEVDEYWDEVKADRGRQASARMELIQIGAMAVRALIDTNPR